MESSPGEKRTHEIPARDFTAHLSALKQQGATLLVVGNLAPEQYRHACQQMLGDESTAPRRRILVSTGHSTPPPEARLPPTQSQPSAATLTHITCETQVRSAAVEAVATPSQFPTKRVDETDLSALGVTVSEAIDEFEQATAELAPAEVRVCFDSLDPLLSDHDTDTVFQFLHLLTGRIHNVRGMGHFHLPVAREHESVRILAPLFDAVVELRETDEQLHQRWHFPDDDVSTSWLAVS